MTPTCELLPERARQMLADAICVDVTTPRGESPARTRVLDRAIAAVKKDYPRFFKKEIHHGNHA